jgi:hypothetical protein
MPTIPAEPPPPPPPPTAWPNLITDGTDVLKAGNYRVTDGLSTL